MRGVVRPDPTVPIALPGFVEQLATALVAARLHAAGHPAVDKPITAVLGHLDLLRQETGEPAFTLVAADDALVLQGRWPVPPSLPASRLVEVLRRWNAAGLRFLEGVSAAEIGTLLHLLVEVRDGTQPDLAALATAAARAGCRRVGLIASSSGARRGVTDQPTLGDVVEHLSAAFTAIAAGAQLDLALIEACAGGIAAAIDGAVRADGDGLDLARQADSDPLAVLHAVRVTALSLVVARSMTRDQELLQRVGVAALLHDVGRMLLPLDLMEETPDLDASSEKALLEHPTIGAEYLMSHADVDGLCVAVAFGHHLLHGGAGGYPQTCHEHHTSRVTEIVSIADKFEALTARRPHRPPMTPSRAYRALIASRTGPEPGLMRRFVEANGLHPLGATVELTSGETARVVRQTADIEAPIVRVLTPGQSGAPRGGLIDLSRQRGVATRIVTPDGG